MALEVLHDDHCIRPLLAERTSLVSSSSTADVPRILQMVTSDHANELFLHIFTSILWTYEVCFTREGVFNVHNSHLWGWENPHASRERGYEVRFRDSVRAGNVGDFSVPMYATWQAEYVVISRLYVNCCTRPA
jgi:hypothetical protein